jgi:hypothetical protein
MHFEGTFSSRLKGQKDLVVSIPRALYPVDYPFSWTVNDLISTGQRELVTIEN